MIEHKPSPDFGANDTSNLQAGQKVEHQKFGFGEVVKMEGAAHNPIATVKFDQNGEKKIMLNYAKLRIVEWVREFCIAATIHKIRDSNMSMKIFSDLKDFKFMCMRSMDSSQYE